MKIIKDYLHLYLGCECQIDGGLATLDGILLTNDRTVTVRFREDQEFITYSASEIKPILRTLSTITEEEMRVIVLINYSVKNTLKKIWLDGYEVWFSSTGFLSGNKCISLLDCNPESYKYLLSKGFDLFELIGSGLAIDKTTLTEQSF